MMAPTKVELQKLPTACPELNAGERFFKELPRQMACKVCNTLKQAEDTVEKLLQAYFHKPGQGMSITLFSYLDNTS